MILHLVSTVKGPETNRAHPDIGERDVDTAIAQIAAIGGTLKRAPTIYPRPHSYEGEPPLIDWAVMQDRFGNEFCLVSVLTPEESQLVEEAGRQGARRLALRRGAQHLTHRTPEPRPARSIHQEVLMRITKNDIPTKIDVPAAVARQTDNFGDASDYGSMAGEYFSLGAGTDIAPLLMGLDDDSCQAPHWGFMASGEVVISHTTVHRRPAGRTTCSTGRRATASEWCRTLR